MYKNMIELLELKNIPDNFCIDLVSSIDTLDDFQEIDLK